MTSQNKMIFFKHDNVVLKTEYPDILDKSIEVYKELLAFTFKLNVDNIYIEHKELQYSEIDSTPQGLYDWRDVEAKILSKGVELTISEDSTEFLDAIMNDTLDEYLILV